MNLRELLVKGHEAQGVAKTTKEEANRGKLRIGSVGAVCADNEIRGVCPRVALLRKLGIEKPAPLFTRIMWNLGEVGEINFERVLNAAGVEVLSQELIELDVDGTKVTGHPDALIEVDGVKYGIELKSIFSFNTAALVSLSRKPKNENFIQAMAYSLATGLPWKLLYTNPNYINGYHNKKYTKLLPFYTVFDLKWEKGVAYYKHEEETEWVETLVTEESIKDFYRLVLEQDAKKRLGPRPTGNYVCGGKAQYPDMCGICDFSAACSDYDVHGNYDDWLTNCKSATTE